MLVYPSGIDVSSSALRFLSTKLRRHRRELGTRWRRLSPGRQALLTLAHLRNGHPYAQLATGFGIGTTTAYRYVAEAVELLAALAPALEEAARTASTKAFVLMDGTLLLIDRIAADRPFHSGKHKKRGMNVQGLADPSGWLLWTSPALPGAVHDVRTAHEHGVVRTLTDADITCWADKGYRGAGGTVRVPYRGRWETPSRGQKAVSRSHAEIRALVEQAVATLKSWLLLRKPRYSTTRVTSLVRAVVTLHLVLQRCLP
ncbi:IS5/IS1182 family transposase [Streptomyces alfalfae]|uniref:Transposase n=1 Tax=Streptomyces alfalfae TaxID=1642299 RepID=A0ABM6GLX9_9ACTN|nr:MULTISPECIES: IS5/IS1182 family transposase [Streptomyces]APY84545.1 transposase [Streptomyces alfalfae]RXX47103.1 IS5/IS1182 family transposase [Streptomyces alfalfae]RZM99163.1 IS5/IS1182 family transposase [Streptomyces alfalfae]